MLKVLSSNFLICSNMSKTNKVQLIGNVGQNPKLVGNSTENSVLVFSMATHETYKDSQGIRQKRTEWHNIVAFGKVAGLIQQYVQQGSHVMIEGRLQTRNYIVKEGVSRFATEIICEEILFLQTSRAEQTPPAVPQIDLTNDQDEPF
jgi:single-strand DNA-binding protein